MKTTILITLTLVLVASETAYGRSILLWPDGTGDYPTIQAAIDNSSDGDVIYLFPGTYTGAGNRDLDFLGKSITVQSVAPNFPEVVAITIIDCNGTAAEPQRAFYLHSNEDANAVIAGLTITRGYASDGGGIYCFGADPTITFCTITECVANNNGGGIYFCESNSNVANCTLTNNSSDYGGAICFLGGYHHPALSNCIITDNSATDRGGAIYCEDVAYITITDCNIIGNSVTSGASGCGGGAIACLDSGELTVVGSTIADNTAVAGGGGILWLYRGSLKIKDSTIIHNTCTAGPGGAILFNSYSSNLRINRCIINGNKAAGNGGAIWQGLGRAIITNTIVTGNSSDSSGAGIYYDMAGLKLINCIFTGNRAMASGGAIYAAEQAGIDDITNTTISDNWAQLQTGGIYVACGDAAAIFPLYLTNCIVWGNIDGSGTTLDAQLRTCSPDAHTVRFSCVQDDNPSDANVPYGADPNFNIDDDPCFVTRGYWADANDVNVSVEPNDPGAVWVDGDYHLLLDSPCMERADSAAIPPAQSVSVDLDGKPRIIGLDVDMGAYESGLKIIIVTGPEQGDIWVRGSSREINWYSYAVTGTVDISYSDNNGTTWLPVTGGLSNIGSYTWHVPASVDSSQCLVSVAPSVPDPNVISVVSGLFTIHPDFVHPPVPSKWKSLGGGFDRSGLSTDLGPQRGCVQWQFHTGDRTISSVTIGAGDRVHIACRDGKLYTINSTGSLVWTFDVNSPLLSAPTVGLDGSVYVGSEDGKLYAISIAGTLRWTHATGGPVSSSPAVSPDGKVFVCSHDGIVYALDSDGTKLWTFQTNAVGNAGGPIYASPSIGPDGSVYVGAVYDANLYALEPNTGTMLWACSFVDPCHPNRRNWAFTSPVVAPDGTIYQTLLYDANLYAIQPDTGTIIWSIDLDDPNITVFDSYNFSSCHYPEYGEWCCWGFSKYIKEYPYVDGWAEPVLGPDGTIYVTFDEDPYLRAVNPDGTIKWIKQLGIMGGFTLTVGVDGLIYAASDDAYLYVLDPGGNVIAKIRGDTWLGFPVIAENGTIIVTDANDTIQAISSGACDGQPVELHRPQDLNGDGTVNNFELSHVLTDWLKWPEGWIWWYGDGPTPYLPRHYDPEKPYMDGDIDGDLIVYWCDLAQLADAWLTQE
jgi:predicted outer membrane repeat protein/parallel beta-helix repeat protein